MLVILLNYASELIAFVAIECITSIYQCVLRPILAQLNGEKSLQWVISIFCCNGNTITLI